MGLMSDLNVSLEICPECGGSIIDLNQIGEIVCSQCGLVINERGVDVNHSDKRAYTSQEKKQREHGNIKDSAANSFRRQSESALRNLKDHICLY